MSLKTSWNWNTTCRHKKHETHPCDAQQWQHLWSLNLMVWLVYRPNLSIVLHVFPSSLATRYCSNPADSCIICTLMYHAISIYHTIPYHFVMPRDTLYNSALKHNATQHYTVVKSVLMQKEIDSWPISANMRTWLSVCKWIHLTACLQRCCGCGSWQLFVLPFLTFLITAEILSHLCLCYHSLLF